MYHGLVLGHIKPHTRIQNRIPNLLNTPLGRGRVPDLKPVRSALV